MSTLSEANEFLKQGEEFFRHRQLEEAIHSFVEAAVLFRKEGASKESAVAFAKAAHSEKLRGGLTPLAEAAAYSEQAAREAAKSKEYAFARWQYREAGLLYEREGDFQKYSHCFVESQNVFVDYLLYIWRFGKKQSRSVTNTFSVAWPERINALIAAIFGIGSRLVWGYGENPFRTVLFGLLVILGCGTIYYFSDLISVNGAVRSVSFFEGIYLSGITFSTVGYGDLVPTGWVRLVSLIEALTGFVLVPLLLISLTRRYLRVYR